MDAQSTREELMRILEKHPPSVGRILKLDPSLMRSESYLAAYPELREFLTQHNEVPQNSQYTSRASGSPRTMATSATTSSSWRRQCWRDLPHSAPPGIVLGTLVWLIRTVLDQRRWSRLSKIQAEVHSKLMDRFSSNDELLTYVQTPSGRRFLESGPSPLQQDMAPAMAAPLARILWSMQIGVVLLVAGLGLLFLSGRALFENPGDFLHRRVHGHRGRCRLPGLGGGGIPAVAPARSARPAGSAHSGGCGTPCVT